MEDVNTRDWHHARTHVDVSLSHMTMTRARASFRMDSVIKLYAQYTEYRLEILEERICEWLRKNPRVESRRSHLIFREPSGFQITRSNFLS
ncbi:uncharacterized protein BDV14DRAFT_131468 [Aspergillus stella-maris]|uniref:uncharacterized protein n=1 Tax=Aspergillus stella-maris TaxID=1810926 RepID=UPI003CCE5039